MTDFDPKLDLVLERYIVVTPEKVWAAWTVPDILMQWFTPAPWKTVACEIDLRPGGKFRTVMQGPDGESNDGTGCYLEVQPDRKLVWTSALGQGYRPNVPQYGVPTFTCILELTPKGGGTVYRATAVHGTEADAKIHADMGFADGWGTALDQLLALMSR